MTEKKLSDLELFREEKDRFFKISSQSPLTRDQKKTFTGLKYFPENPAFRLELAVDPLPDAEPIQMQTSTGESRSYPRFGKIHFTVEGQPAELTIYGDEDSLFLPFVDSLANKETYGAGRYLEPELLPDGRLLVDFNLAYNPYCAYNESWSCPLTPFENRLKQPIHAGEKIFEPHGE